MLTFRRPAPDPSASAPAPARPEKASWDWEAGRQIVPGRHVIQHLGGGSAYEVFLVWDDRRFALMVAKVLRPDRAADPSELRSLRLEADALSSLAHPVL